MPAPVFPPSAGLSIVRLAADCAPSLELHGLRWNSCAECTFGVFAMDKIRDTALVSDQAIRATHQNPQKIDEGAEAASEITATSGIEERFANWGTD